jgi:hypothetical protein
MMTHMCLVSSDCAPSIDQRMNWEDRDVRWRDEYCSHQPKMLPNMPLILFFPRTGTLEASSNQMRALLSETTVQYAESKNLSPVTEDDFGVT